MLLALKTSELVNIQSLASLPFSKSLPFTSQTFPTLCPHGKGGPSKHGGPSSKAQYPGSTQNQPVLSGVSRTRNTILCCSQ